MESFPATLISYDSISQFRYQNGIKMLIIWRINHIY